MSTRFPLSSFFVTCLQCKLMHLFFLTLNRENLYSNYQRWHETSATSHHITCVWWENSNLTLRVARERNGESFKDNLKLKVFMLLVWLVGVYATRWTAVEWWMFIKWDFYWKRLCRVGSFTVYCLVSRIYGFFSELFSHNEIQIKIEV